MVLAVVALVGLTAAPLPFTGDQALYTIIGHQLTDGDALYRDVWDIKQPGIFLYYGAGGLLFGFSEIGLHLFELVTLLGFGVVLQVTLRRRVRNEWVASITPLLVVALFYAGARPIDLGQIEVLVGFPLYLCLLWSLPPAGGAVPSSRRLALSGLAGGAVAMLKLIYLVIPAAFWLVAIVVAVRAAPTRRLAAGARVALPVAAGLAVPVGASIAYFAATGQLGEVWWLYFDYARDSTGAAGRPLSRIVDALVGDGLRFATILVLAGTGIAVLLRRRADRLDGFVIGLLAWLVLAVPLWLGQHSWVYQLKLFLVPVAVLAAFGVDALWEGRRRVDRRGVVVVTAVLVVLTLPALSILARRAVRVARHDLALTDDGRRGLAEEYEPKYVDGRAWADQLREPGPVYVLGNPIGIFLAGRDQAIRTNGWSPEQFDDRVWERVARELDDARPRYLAIDDEAAAVMADRAPRTEAAIDELYCTTGQSGELTWYELRRAGTCAAGA